MVCCATIGVSVHAEEVEALARFAQEMLGRVDIWVNNAGISQAHKATLQHTDAEELRRVLDTNLLGSIFGARAALQVRSSTSRRCMNTIFLKSPSRDNSLLACVLSGNSV